MKNRLTIRLLAAGVLSVALFISHAPLISKPRARPKTAPQTELTRQEIQRVTRSARQAESDDEFVRALELWRFVMENKPGDYSSYLGIKRCLTRLEQYDEALDFIGSMIPTAQKGRSKLDPLALAIDRIDILFIADRREDAIHEAVKLSEDFRGNQNMYSDLARVYFGQRMTDEAVALLHRGRIECENPFLFARDLANWAESRNDWETAVSEYLLYLESKPGRLSYVTGAIGDIPVEMGADSIATVVIRRRMGEVTSRTTLKSLSRLLASLHFRARRFAEALEVYRQLDSEDSPGKEILEFAQLLFNEDEFDLAWQAYEDLARQNLPRSITSAALLGKSRTALALGMADSARAALNELLSLSKQPEIRFEVFRGLGNIEISSGGEPALARKHFQSALDASRSFKLKGEPLDEVKVSSALTWALEGDFDRAATELKIVIRQGRLKSAAAARARIEMTRMAFREGDAEETTNQANALLMADPASQFSNEALELLALTTDLKEDQTALKRLGSADRIAYLGDVSGAEKILDSLSRFATNSKTIEAALWSLVSLHTSERNHSHALDDLNRIIAMGDDALKVDGALEAAGRICEDSDNRTGEAADYYERLLVDYPDSPLADKVRKRLQALSRES